MVKKSKQIFGLLGRNIEYSFSRAYFNEKFFSLGLSNYSYQNFDLQNLTNVSEIFNKKNVKGLNVTTPFKKEIMDYLDYIDKIALQVGAVNTIVFDKNRKTTGYNTDWIGFKKSIQKISHKKIHSAIILGTGGASNAVAYALDKLNISYVFVSRNSNTNSINYKDLTKKGIPITGTSANISGQPETKDINVLKDSLDLNIVKMIISINCGKEQSASTVIKLSKARMKMLREGPIKSNEIKEILGNGYKYE